MKYVFVNDTYVNIANYTLRLDIDAINCTSAVGIKQWDIEFSQYTLDGSSSLTSLSLRYGSISNVCYESPSASYIGEHVELSFMRTATNTFQRHVKFTDGASFSES
jgi:hypothetical protein